jgi:uncharacterized protein
MPPAWSTPLDIERIADEQTELDFEMPLGDLPRLRERLVGSGGTVRGHIRFRRELGFAVADLTVSGRAILTCQRCLGAVTESIASTASVALVADEARLERVPDHLEPVLAPGGRIKPAELIEEELLLALPIVALHAAPSECVTDIATAESADPAESTTQKPFERLGELLKR